MKLWMFLCTLLISMVGRADLLERFHIESAIQERLQGIIKIYDPAGKVLVHVEYHNYEGSLPGTTWSAEKVSPDHVESIDVAKVTVDVYSSLIEVPDEAQTALRNALPVKDKRKIDIKIHAYDGAHVNTTTKPVEVKDLADIVHGALEIIGKQVGIFAGAAFLLLLMFTHLQNSRQLRNTRDQIRLLAGAIGEAGGGGGGRAVAAPQAQAARVAEPPVASSGGGDHPFEAWPTKALKELIADAYWCGLDSYANWLWKELTSSQKYELLSELPFLREYSAFFVDGPAVPASFHEHPYYLDPQSLFNVSQSDLSEAVKRDIGLWHVISPMRRHYLPVSLQEKVSAVQSTPTKAAHIPAQKSAPRAIEAKPAWGDISASDEQVLYENPDMVPVAMRKHIRSLVWLAKKDNGRVRQVLSKYDARSLASAWVGPDDVLKTLEAGLPEKKLKLLQTYKSKMEPSRNSDVYQTLVEEGLSDEAA